MSGPLHGLVILDLTQLVQGPFATQILGDMGADILKVEPSKGDWLRGFAIDNYYINGESVSFLGFNRNKRSLTLNLKDPAGIDILKRLITKVDVVVENFRPGVMDRLGIGYETLSAINPRLIYCASSGFGQTGPYVSRPGQDLLIQAMTGIPWLTGKRDDLPVVPGVSLADLAAGLHIVYGILAALYCREQTGKGQRVDVNLYSSLLTFIQQEMSLLLNGGRAPERSASGIPNAYTGAPYGLYKTSDGFIAIGMNPLNKLAALLGVPGYEAVTSNNVMDNRDTIREHLAAAFLTRTSAAWLDLLLKEDIWCSPVYNLNDVEHDPQVAENHMIASYEHPTVGRVRTIGIPVQFSDTPGAIDHPAPLLGEHSDDILREFGGYTDDDVRGFKQRGII
ncbi:MAG: CoA transferase [Anaerolineae bacterium]|nr:CoA transferase [Anaerolineae bacterium]